MRFSLLPSHKFPRVEDISPAFLKEKGVKLLILDVDNTIAPYKTVTLRESVVAWARDLQAAGITLFIVSNNKGDRPEIFARLLGIEYIKRAGKPSPRGVIQGMAVAGFKPSETALVGDQIYTDTIAANLAGVRALLVEPIRFTNPFLAIRYVFELPFRHESKS